MGSAAVKWTRGDVGRELILPGMCWRVGDALAKDVVAQGLLGAGQTRPQYTVLFEISTKMYGNVSVWACGDQLASRLKIFCRRIVATCTRS